MTNQLAGERSKPARSGFHNSVLCGWFLASEASDDGDAIAHQLSQVDAHAPCPPPERKATTSLLPDRRQLKHRLGVGLGGTPSMIRWA
jgi:hypothetical protein